MKNRQLSVRFAENARSWSKKVCVKIALFGKYAMLDALCIARHRSEQESTKNPRVCCCCFRIVSSIFCSVSLAMSCMFGYKRTKLGHQYQMNMVFVVGRLANAPSLTWNGTAEMPSHRRMPANKCSVKWPDTHTHCNTELDKCGSDEEEHNAIIKFNLDQRNGNSIFSFFS